MPAPMKTIPYVPVGTAHLIDALALFLQMVLRLDDHGANRELMDRAVAIRIVPHLDTDTAERSALESFATQLREHWQRTRRSVREIAAAGLYAPD